ncbi:MAG: hypothetical protein ACXW27_10880 [Allosphingosinicella sp.]
MKLQSQRFIKTNAEFDISRGCKGGRAVKVKRPQIRGDFAIVDTNAWQCVFHHVRYILQRQDDQWKVIAGMEFPAPVSYACERTPASDTPAYLMIKRR